MLSQNEKLLLEKKFFNVLDEAERLRYEELLRNNEEFRRYAEHDGVLKTGMAMNAARFVPTEDFEAENLFSQKLGETEAGKIIIQPSSYFLKNYWRVLFGGTFVISVILLSLYWQSGFNGDKYHKREVPVSDKAVIQNDTVSVTKSEIKDSIVLKNSKFKIKDSLKNNKDDKAQSQNVPDSIVKKEKKIPVLLNDTVKTKFDIKP